MNLETICFVYPPHLQMSPYQQISLQIPYPLLSHTHSLRELTDENVNFLTKKSGDYQTCTEGLRQHIYIYIFKFYIQ